MKTTLYNNILSKILFHTFSKEKKILREQSIFLLWWMLHHPTCIPNFTSMWRSLFSQQFSSSPPTSDMAKNVQWSYSLCLYLCDFLYLSLWASTMERIFEQKLLATFEISHIYAVEAWPSDAELIQKGSLIRWSFFWSCNPKEGILNFPSL